MGGFNGGVGALGVVVDVVVGIPGGLMNGLVVTPDGFVVGVTVGF